MCFQTEFGLLLNQEQITPKDSGDITTARFIFNFEGIKPLGVGSQDLQGRFLEQRLEEMVPVDKRKLTIRFRVNTKRLSGSTVFTEVIRSVDLFVEGDILKGLHSAMSCDKEERIGLKLKADLAGVRGEEENAGGPRHITTAFSTGGCGYVELSPEFTGGEMDHGKYACLNLELNLHSRPVSFGTILASWKVSNLSLVVQHVGCTCDMLIYLHATRVNRKLLTEGLGADVEILAKDKAIIPCHGSILISQSTVIDRMLEKDHFVEGSTRRIEMPEWSQSEVTAFLSHLYYGGGADAAVNDVSINMALFKMGDYYEIKTLKDKMKTIMLRRSVLQISVDNAFTLFELGRLLEDADLAGKGLEALKWRSDDVLQQSELFRNAFPTGIGREMVRSLLSMVRVKG